MCIRDRCRGDGDVFTKFGIRIQDEMTFVISRRRFIEEISTHVEDQLRPNDGDMVYFPFTKDTFIVKYVEHKLPFWVLNKQYVWGLRCEMFEYSDETIETGIDEIDDIQINFATALDIILKPNGIGDFVVGEEIYGNTSETTAKVSKWDKNTLILTVVNRSGSFHKNENIVNDDEETSWLIETFNEFENSNSEYDTNNEIESESNEILDFTESNPFGEYGTFGEE